MGCKPVSRPQRGKEWTSTRAVSLFSETAWTASYLKSRCWLANKVPSVIELLPLDLLSKNSDLYNSIEYTPEPITTIPELKAFLGGETEIPSQRMITKDIFSTQPPPISWSPIFKARAIATPLLVQELQPPQSPQELQPPGAWKAQPSFQKPL
jgi:hypothetical protein